jgi:hypothetical protein
LAISGGNLLALATYLIRTKSSMSPFSSSAFRSSKKWSQKTGANGWDPSRSCI